jgi:MoxR-like ATPase
MVFGSIEQVAEELGKAHYIADRALATVVFLAYRLQKPIFLEGEPGVGKTEVGTVMARLFDTELIRLQCYEGLDAATALYEWNYPKQLLHIRLEEQEKKGKEEIERVIYGPEFLIKRPLLEAILSSNEKTPVLLIDEVDRSDEEFEASFEKEYQIVVTRLPQIQQELAKQVAHFMQKIRSVDFLKRPGVSETLDWASALITMERKHLDEDVVKETLGCILKYQDDIRRFREEIWADPEKRGGYLQLVESDG